MHRSTPSTRGLAAGVLTAAALAFLPERSAQAAEPDAAVPAACDGQVLVQPFMPWLDPASYVLAPSGTVERGAGWDLEDGAARFQGNESFQVNDQDDAWSLALPPGASATTAAMCVGLEHPTLRLFVRNRGSALSPLIVEVLFTDVLGQSRTVPIGAYLGSSRWQPTPPLPVLANLFALLPGEHVDVAFRFTAQGAGDWSIDDVYVDPFRKG